MFCRRTTVPWCLKFIPISRMGPKHATKDTDLNFQPFQSSFEVFGYFYTLIEFSMYLCA